MRKTVEKVVGEFVNGSTTAKTYLVCSKTAAFYGRRLFVEGNVLYSYGLHFPLGIRTEKVMFINKDKYSQTTATHQRGLELLAERSGFQIYKLSTEDMRKVRDDKKALKLYTNMALAGELVN